MQSLKVNTPTNFQSERKYIINILLKEFLGLEYELCFDDNVEHTILSIHGKEIVIKDGFWNNYNEDNGYLSKEALPSVHYITSDFTIDNDLPVLYGDGEIKIIGVNRVICGIDIFASAFFMLTRWEEIVVKEKDKHGRFCGTDSIAYKHNFLHRPIVNEYVELLSNLFSAISCNVKIRKPGFGLIPTHDIDWLEMSHHRIKSFKSAIYSLIKKKDLKLSLYHLSNVFKRNPFDTCDFLIAQSKIHHLKSHFYFMAAGAEIEFYNRDNYLESAHFHKTIMKIRGSGNYIGFHPSYFTYNDGVEWENEFQELKKAVGTVNEGRQHFLMIKIPETLRIWDKNGMTIDSSLGYADHEGFRCGTGNEYTFFDVKKRKVMNLKERPLIIMDGTLKGYRNLNLAQSYECFKYYIEIGKRYNMPITILFHNSSFTLPMWKDWKSLYEKTLSLAD